MGAAGPRPDADFAAAEEAGCECVEETPQEPASSAAAPSPQASEIRDSARQLTVEA
jgi:hypothetical protein